MNSSKIVKNAKLKIYPGGSHSLGDTSKDELNADLLAFVRMQWGLGMDPAALSAVAAVLGLVVGGTTSIATAWPARPGF